MRGLAALAAVTCVACIWPQAGGATGPGGNGKIAVAGVSPIPSGQSPQFRIWTMEPNGSGLTTVSPPELTDPRHPAWSPDGTKIALSVGGTATPGIWVMNADGSAPFHVAGTGGTDFYPDWSPDGQRLVFTRGGGEGFLHVVDVAGTAPPAQLGNAFGSYPAWSPNGQKIAFTGFSGAADVMVVAADGSSAPVNLTNLPGREDSQPDWSPDGQRIAFVSARAPTTGSMDDGRSRLWIMDANGANVTQFTDPPTNPGGQAGRDTGPVWSPDGQKIAFARTQQTSDNFVMTKGFDGANAVPITPISDSTTRHSFHSPDWQVAPKPVIFVHGFLASRLRCNTGSGEQEVWPNLPNPLLPAFTLAADGLSDAGDGTCAGPVQPNGVLETALGEDVHASTLEFLRNTSPGANYVYAWDWRKSPEQALAGLDALVDQVRAAHGNSKVSILAHSFGGLVTRWYIDSTSRAAKVERALIVGTPSWGSPKALFPLATGQESPAGLVGLDLLFVRDELKALARNLLGAFFLYPSANYGTWLTVRGRVPSVLDTQQKVVDYVEDDLLGNGTLLQQAFDAHANVLDAWDTNGVDVRALVGTGMNTVVGVDLIPGQGTLTEPDSVELRLGNGDETVPARSATQGTPGTSDPLGENIPISYACGVSHVPLAGRAALDAAGAGAFLTLGESLLAPAQPCSNGGFSIEVHGVDLTPPNEESETGEPALEADGAGQSLGEAEAAGKIDVVRFPAMAAVVTNDSRPVSLTIADPDAQVVVRRVDGEAQGAPQTFGPDPDGLQITTASGGTIAVTSAGSPGPGPAPSPPPGGPVAAPPATGPSASPLPAPVRASVLGVIARRDGSLRARVRVGGAGSLVLEAFARRTALVAAAPRGTLSVAKVSRRVTRAGTVTLTLKAKGRGLRTLRRRGRLAAKLRTTFRPASGRAPAPITRSVTFKLRRR
jgi:Lecithin:cholesterol acyltransferase/WD40-like Beta Propeller Repeat